MKTYFRLYSNTQTEFNSSIFDLINGDNETKQTKGLAYILSQYDKFLFAFINSPKVKKVIKNKLNIQIDYNRISSIVVSAERFTIDKKRADIIIKIEQDKLPLVALIIEAKNIKTYINQDTLSKQIEHYLEDNTFPDLINYPKIGIVLTKYNQNIPNVININWNDIIQLLFDFCKKDLKNSLIKQYLLFLTQIDKAMKYYEKEVLSIPAGRSIENVEKYNIYVCPDTKDYSYKKPLFVTFRAAKGGIMNKLYKIEDILILNPTNKSEIESLLNSTYSENIKNRIIEYIKASNYSDINYDERFYILSESENIDLPNNPKPQRNNAKFTYYTLKDILTKEIVIPESKL